MTTHLTSQEVIDALDGTLGLARQAHLDTCGTCARAVAALRLTEAAAEESADVPEPSPLFWAHFSNRVREATNELPIERAPWWSRFWQPALALGAIGAVTLMVMTVSRAPEAPAGAGSPVIASMAPATDDVLALDNENKVVIKRVVPGGAREGHIIVQQGLNEGDKIIVEGIQKVRPGQVVTPGPPGATGA